MTRHAVVRTGTTTTGNNGRGAAPTDAASAAWAFARYAALGSGVLRVWEVFYSRVRRGLRSGLTATPFSPRGGRVPVERPLAQSIIRRTVANALGVEPEYLRADVSLGDDLAVDGCDMEEVRVELEAELGIELPRRMLTHVSTYHELVDVLVHRLAARPPVALRASSPVLARARVFSSQRNSASMIWTGGLTPYAVEIIAEAALSVPPRARLEVGVLAGAHADLDWAVDQFAALKNRGVDVSVMSG